MVRIELFPAQTLQDLYLVKHLASQRAWLSVDARGNLCEILCVVNNPIKANFIRSITTVIFDEIADLRSRVPEIDELLKERFNTPGVSYAVGEGINPSVPRMNYKSKFGHSSLDISCVSAQMTTHFDGDYSSNFDLITKYCLEREQLIENDVAKMGSRVRYVGFAITSQVGLDNRNKAVQTIVSNFMKANALLGQTNTHEASFKVAFVESDRYFVNFHAGNFQAYTLQIKADQKGLVRIVNPSMMDFAEAGAGLEFTFDCNNKFLYDFKDKDGHQADDFKKVLSIADSYQKKVTGGGFLNV